VLGREEIRAIGEVCRRRNLWIVSDEVYEELVFEGSFASPFDLPELAERTIVTSSISKSHAAPGFRSGWAIGPAELCNKLLPISESMLFGGQPFIADMTAFALTHDLPTAGIMRQHYSRRAKLLADQLGRIGGLDPIAPAAGMFLMLDVSGTGMSGDDFAKGLLESQNVSVMPGSSFGAEARGCVRVSLTVPDAILQEACNRIARFVATEGARAVSA
jgi:arginine:pyruvate transaminase